MDKLAREWASYTGFASLVLAFMGLVCGLYGACVWPAWGCAGAAVVSCRLLQLSMCRCN